MNKQVKKMESYNPDVLSCLANLSNDEVFTSPKIANEVLDLLPTKIWSDKNAKFLDPCVKNGVFLREITRRLIKGLESEIPDLQKRVNHICKNQIFGIAITSLTALTSRRSLYCSKTANGKYSICTNFDDADGNILYKNLEHTWVLDKAKTTAAGGPKYRCSFCGAPKELFDRDDALEQHAYMFIHTKTPEEILNMNFDVIIGNPPYQLSDGGNNASAIPLYNKFVEQAKKLRPRYLCMIIPSRWYCGGRGLEKFRNEMLSDGHLKELHDFKKAADCFPGIRNGGGICYFLWDSLYNSNIAKIVEHNQEGVIAEEKRPLDEFGNEIFIRDSIVCGIIRKVQSKNEPSFAENVYTQKPYGFRTNFKDFMPDGDIKIYTKKEKSGYAYVNRDQIDARYQERFQETIDDWKVVTSRTTSVPEEDNGQVLRMCQTFIVEPNAIVTESYVMIGTFKTKVEAENCYSYLKTRFFRFLCQPNIVSPDVSKRTFIFVPQKSFKKSWNDEELFKMYNLSPNEIEYIKSTIKEVGD